MRQSQRPAGISLAEVSHPWGRSGGSFLGQGFPVAARDLPVGERNSPGGSNLLSASLNNSPSSLKVPSRMRQAAAYYMEVIKGERMSSEMNGLTTLKFSSDIYNIYSAGASGKMFKIILN